MAKYHTPEPQLKFMAHCVYPRTMYNNVLAHCTVQTQRERSIYSIDIDTHQIGIRQPHLPSRVNAFVSLYKAISFIYDCINMYLPQCTSAFASEFTRALYLASDVYCTFGVPGNNCLLGDCIY